MPIWQATPFGQPAVGPGPAAKDGTRQGVGHMSLETIIIIVVIVLIVLFVLGYFGRGRMRG